MDARVLRVIWGDDVAPALRRAVEEAGLVVSARSDRAGVRLSGGPAQATSGSMPSEPMALGAMQLPPGGELIVMGVERPVTGGYLVIGCVAAIDHAAIGQLRPGARVRCEGITREQARGLWLTRERELQECLIPQA